MIPLVASIVVVLAGQATPPAFRTDDSPKGTKLPWYRIQPGRVPPAGSAHRFGGELVDVDPLQRRGTIRVDRTDAQRVDEQDFTVEFGMLPYGSLGFLGAPAELRDVPIGTHLHGEFYLRPEDEPKARPWYYGRISPEHEFTRCLRLEDDFTRCRRLGRAWRVEAVDLGKRKLTVVGLSVADGVAEEKTSVFDLTPATRVWKGEGTGTPADLAKGTTVLVNLTWATQYGPGRCTDIWLDEAACTAATARQREIHRQWQRDRGLAGSVVAVDNPKRIIMVELFDIIDRSLADGFRKGAPMQIIVAEPCLRSYDQVNDKMEGLVLRREEVPDPPPGSTGIRITVRPQFLLEGFRPGRVVRIFADGWPVVTLPREERLWPARD